MEELNWVIILLSWVLFFMLSYIYVEYFLLKDHDLRQRFGKVLFSMTFSTSCSMLQLFLLELSLFSVSHLIWQIILLTFTVLMIYITPFYLMFKMLNYRYYLWVVFIIGYLCVLELNCSFVGHGGGAGLHFSVLEQIKLVGVDGVIISALLSGFGAINCTYSYFNFFNEDLLKTDLAELVSLCKKNTQCLVAAKLNKNKANVSSQKNWKSLWGVLNPTSELDKYQEEIKSYETIHQQYLKHIKTILKNQEKQKTRYSLKGRFYYLLARVLTLYSIYKIVISWINYILKRKYSLDPIARLLQILGYFVYISPYFIEFVSTYVSFGFIGLLIFMNIRSFLLLLISIINLCSKLISSGLSSQILMIIISEVTGAYFMATVLLMRANIPEDKRESMTYALNGIDFDSFHHIFDVTFTISSVVTAALFYLKHKLSFKSKLL
jgi:golgi pH regulator